MEYSSSVKASTLGAPTLANSQIQGILASSLNSEKYTVENKKTNVVFEPTGNFFAPLADNNVIDTSNNKDDEEEEEEDEEEDDDTDKKKGRFQFINDPINTFFIGSITVVGLFVLFRMLQKNK